jgi:undecaprenyl-diphosphatase
MMTTVHAIILGVVEGLTEFLPVSSTAHLIIFSKILHLPQNEFQSLFEVFIQAGAILAVGVLYIKYLLRNLPVIKELILSFIPTAIIGFLLQKIITTVFFKADWLILLSMVVIAAVFLFVERKIAAGKLHLEHKITDISTKDALLIGLAQALAVVPGVSRAGIVIVFMMTRGYKRSEAAVYSFLLALPTIFAASAYDLYKSRHILGGLHNATSLLAIGSAVAFVTALLSVKWFVGFLQRNTLVVFAYYRFVLAIIVAVLLVTRVI